MFVNQCILLYCRAVAHPFAMPEIHLDFNYTQTTVNRKKRPASPWKNGSTCGAPSWGRPSEWTIFPCGSNTIPKCCSISSTDQVCAVSLVSSRVSSSWMKWPIFCCSLPGTGVITKSELKFFYTAFMDVGKLGEAKLDEITNNAYEALTSVNYSSVTFFLHCAHFFTRQPKVLYCELHCSSNLIRYNSVLRRAVLLKTKRVVHLKPLLPCAHTVQCVCAGNRILLQFDPEGII